MSEEVDLYRAAWLLMKQYGIERALEICEEREDLVSRESDLLAVAAWRAVRRAIEELDRKPKPGERMN